MPGRALCAPNFPSLWTCFVTRTSDEYFKTLKLPLKGHSQSLSSENEAPRLTHTAQHCTMPDAVSLLKMEQNSNMVYRGVAESDGVMWFLFPLSHEYYSPRLSTHSTLTRRIHFSLRNWTRNVQQSSILSRLAWIEIDISHHKLKSNYSRKCFLGLLFVSILRIFTLGVFFSGGSKFHAHCAQLVLKQITG